jgi:ribose transport system substrate-binding protein
MPKHFRLLALAATLTASALVLTGCSLGDFVGGVFGGSTQNTADPSEGSPEAALAAAYAGVTSDQMLLAVDFPEAVQNVAIVSCPLSIPSCAASANAVSDAVVLAGWWPMIIDGGDPAGVGQAIRIAIAQAATVIVMMETSCRGLEIPLDEVALAGVPVIAVGGEDNCDPKRFAVTTRWTAEHAVGKRQTMVGALQADYVFGRTTGEVKALVLTVADDPYTTKISEGFTEKLTKLGGGEAVEKLALTAAEISDKSFTKKVVDAAKTSGANAIIVPEDDWLTTGGLAAALARDPKTSELLVIGHGGTAAALDIIRSGGAGLTATVGQSFDWMGWGAVDAIVRLYAGAPTVFIGDAMQVIDVDHNMPETGKYTGGIDAQEKYAKLWVRATPTPTPSPTNGTNQNDEN